MEEILDPLQENMIRYLPVPDFLRLCRVDQTFASLCRNPDVLSYFFERDYGIPYKGTNFAQDYKIRGMIEEWRKLWQTNPEEAYWMTFPLISYGLPSWELARDDIATIRLLHLLRTYGLLPSFITEYDRLYDNVYNRLFEKSLGFSSDQMTEILTDRSLYEEIMTSRDPRYILAELRNRPTWTIYDIESFILNQFEFKNIPNDPILRNLL